MIGAFIKKRPRAFWYAIIGLVGGVLLGYGIGGIGVAMRGGAFRLDPGFVLALAGAVAGYIAGNKVDRQRRGIN